MDAVKVGEKIAQARKEKDMTQKDLALILGITDKAVSKWERGINFPELPMLEKLAKTLDITVLQLLGLEDEATNLPMEAQQQKLKCLLEKELQNKKEKRLLTIFILCAFSVILIWNLVSVSRTNLVFELEVGFLPITFFRVLLLWIIVGLSIRVGYLNRERKQLQCREDISQVSGTPKRFHYLFGMIATALLGVLVVSCVHRQLMTVGKNVDSIQMYKDGSSIELMDFSDYGDILLDEKKSYFVQDISDVRFPVAISYEENGTLTYWDGTCRNVFLEVEYYEAANARLARRLAEQIEEHDKKEHAFYYSDVDETTDFGIIWNVDYGSAYYEGICYNCWSRVVEPNIILQDGMRVVKVVFEQCRTTYDDEQQMERQGEIVGYKDLINVLQESFLK